MVMMKTLKQQTISENLDFILCHLQGAMWWPRTISTAATYGAQVLVFSEREAIQKFVAANMLDCRINAYPAHTQYKGINRQAPDFIFIDLDRSNFTTERKLTLALDKTLKNIRYLGAEPTVLWSGNGYHVYLPLAAFVLEEEEVFAKFEQPSKRFLRFAARHLSNRKSDLNNNPSLKSCMIRIPGSCNSKYISSGAAASAEVKVIQTWNGYRLPINYLLRDFRRYLIDQRMQETKIQAKQSKSKPQPQRNNQSFEDWNNNIQWIEQLLQTPIPDYRNLTVWHILAPYLITQRGLSYDESYAIIREWLNKCNELEALRFNPHHKIIGSLKGARSFFPISCKNLKIKENRFYNLLKDHGVLVS